MNNLPTTTETSSVQTVSSTLNSITDDGDNHSRGDGLSLFWLIILIILIVWAIGLLAGGFGLGGLINILLVIALILLILWLLRIV
ncbi:MAG: lmo0937 family membrane protein [Bacteroidia bacterium]|nr:lmo0937 family membrane protein [Bacteroidia bacterium]